MHGFERFSPDALEHSIGGVRVVTDQDRVILSAIDARPITSLDQVVSVESRVEFSGDLTFLEDVFLAGLTCSAPNTEYDPLTADGAWKTGRDRLRLTDINTKILCIKVDGETEIPTTAPYTARIDFSGIRGAAFPPVDTTVDLAGIGRNGATVRIPYLTTFEGYNQRIVMRNRSGRVVPYTITFH